MNGNVIDELMHNLPWWSVPCSLTVLGAALLLGRLMRKGGN